MVSQTLTVLQAPMVAGQTGDLVYRLTDSAGKPVNSYDQMHESNMHLFSVDMKNNATPLGEFEHLHPEFLGDGTWKIPGFTAPSGGMDHIIADYSTGGVMGVSQATLNIQGTATPAAVTPDGFHARVTSMTNGAGGPVAHVELTGPDGKPVQQLGTFMGATAHMILFQPESGAQQLGFSHGHAESAIANGGLDVETTMLGTGSYQGWLQFATLDGQVHAAAVSLQR